jgi:hypothetical protein
MSPEAFLLKKIEKNSKSACNTLEIVYNIVKEESI